MNNKFENIHTGKILIKKEGHEVIECLNCGYKHLLPLPGVEDNNEFYEKDFFESLWSNYIEKHLNDKKWLDLHYNIKYDYYESIFEDNKQRRLLDIGSATGFFLETGLSRGWETLGVEPGKAAYEFSLSRGLNVFCEFFNKKNYNKYGKFDVINLTNVLEHLPNPVEIIELCSEILNDEGIISISSPNDFNPLQSHIVNTSDKDYWWVDVKEHINYFDKHSLSNILTQQNFEIINIYSSYPIEIFILNGEDYISKQELGREIHEKRKKFEMDLYYNGNAKLLMDLYKNLSELDLGREINVIGRKKKR